MRCVHFFIFLPPSRIFLLPLIAPTLPYQEKKKMLMLPLKMKLYLLPSPFPFGYLGVQNDTIHVVVGLLFVGVMLGTNRGKNPEEISVARVAIKT